MIATWTRAAVFVFLAGGVVGLTVGCNAARNATPSPVRAGLNTNDLLDPPAQYEADNLGNAQQLFAAAEQLKQAAAKERQKTFTRDPNKPRRSVLCLSGGGS